MGSKETPHATVLANEPSNTPRRRRSAISLVTSGLMILGVIPATLFAQSITATPVFASSSVASLSAGGGDVAGPMTLALKTDGTVWAWGDNFYGELGDGTTTNRTSPVQVLGSGGVGTLSGISAVSAGAGQSLALKSDGTVWAWGDNAFGELGDGTTTERTSPVQVLGSGGVGTLSGVIAIGGGWNHSMALKSDGTVWAWGDNAFGELGDGTTTNRTSPVQVLGSGGVGTLSGVTALDAGFDASMALKSDGTVWAWGDNFYGELGDGTTTDRHTPVQVLGSGGVGTLSGVTAISSGDGFGLALKSDGTVWAWGSNFHGVLGDGTTTDRTSPVQVLGTGGVGTLSGVTAISGGDYSHSHALKSDGSVWSWGNNTDGELGDATTTDRHTPVQVTGVGGVGTLGGIAGLSAGEYHVAALTSAGNVYSWGAGALGDGTTNGSDTPVLSLMSSVAQGSAQQPPTGGPLTLPENPTPNGAQGKAAEPVDTATGAFYASATDVSITGRSYPLAFSRTYSSAMAATNGALGYGWAPSYAMSLAVVGSVVTITQENGGTVTFTLSGGVYTAPPRVIATLTLSGGVYTFIRGNRDTYTFNSSGQLTTEKDLNGSTTTLTYTGTPSVLTSITDPAGRTLGIGWTGTHITTVTDANVSPSRVVTYQYNDGNGNLTDVLDVNGGHWHFTYDAGHQMLTMLDPKCYATSGCPGIQNTYTSNQVTAQKDQLNRQTTFGYSVSQANSLTAAASTTTVTDPKGNVVLHQYSYGLLTSETHGYGTAQAATARYLYDPNTLGLISSQDPNGDVTTYTRDTSGNALTMTDPLGHQTVNTYNSFNEVLTTQDGKGVTTTNMYDSHGNLLSASTPVSGSSCPCQVTTNRYQDPGHIGDLTSKIDPDGNVWNYAYDTYGDHTQTIDPLGDRTEYQYDHDGRVTHSTTPKGARSVVQKAAGGGIATNNGWSMILRADGTDWAWGYNADGETGSGTTATPVTTPKEVCAVGQTSPCSQFLSSLTDIAAGGLQGIAVAGDGTVYDWGNNSVGQLGTGNTTNSTVPVQATGLSSLKVTNVVSGYENNVALSSVGGHLYAWGLNSSGELGDGTTTNRSSPVEVCAAGATAPCSSFLSGVTQIAAHRRYAMALTSGGNVYTWGANDHGQLGNGGSTNQSTPQEVCAPGQTAPCSQFLSNITAIAAGTDFAMALKSDGTVYVWGSNDHGDLANGTTDSNSHPIPAQVSGLTTVTSIAAGKSHALVILNDGSLRSWGLNGNGELGVGAKDTTGCQCRSTVQTVLNVFQATAIAGGDTSSIALTVDGSAWSWGGNAHGELGNGGSGTDVTSPVKFGTITTSVNATYETNYTFNAFGQVLNTTDPLGHVTKNIYDADGNLSTVTDGNNNLTTYVYDVANELTQAKRADSPQTTLTTDYNADGTIIDEKDGKNNPIQTFGYDSLGRKTSVTDALGNVTTITHDGAGNQLTVQDPGGNCSGTPKTGCTTSTYDASNERKIVTYSDGVTPNVTNIAYDADGQRTGMTDGTGTSSWVVDNLHRTTSYTNGNGSQVQYAYNLRNEITTLTYPGSHNVTQGYDAAGRWTSVQDWNGKTTTVAYDQNSNLAAETMPTSGTSVADTFGYNAADQTTSVSSMQGATTIFSATYTRDSNAQLVSDTSAATNQTTFKYTALNQTCYAGSSTSTACSSPPANSQAFAFDAADNLTKDGGATQQFNAADQLCWTLSGASANNCATVPSGATTYSYDTRGNRTSKVTSANAGTCNTFDQAKRITAVTSGTGASCTSPTTLGTYGYDGDGLRMSKGTTHYTWDESGGLRLLLVDGSTDYIYGPGGLPLEQINGATTFWYHHDQIGSTRAMTDSAGTKQASYTYDPYGHVTACTGTTVTVGGSNLCTGTVVVTNPLTYSGEYRDDESGLMYLRARYYDPSTAQFISLDPMVDMTMSPYAYVAGNPLNATDPSGLWGLSCDWCGRAAQWVQDHPDVVVAAIPIVGPSAANEIQQGHAVGFCGNITVNDIAHYAKGRGFDVDGVEDCLVASKQGVRIFNNEIQGKGIVGISIGPSLMWGSSPCLDQYAGPFKTVGGGADLLGGVSGSYSNGGGITTVNVGPSAGLGTGIYGGKSATTVKRF